MVTLYHHASPVAQKVDLLKVFPILPWHFSWYKKNMMWYGRKHRAYSMPLMPLNAAKSSCTQLLEQVEMNIKAGGYLFLSWILRCTQTEGCVVVVQVSHCQPASSCAHTRARFYSLQDSRRMATPQLIAPVKKKVTHYRYTWETHCILHFVLSVQPLWITVLKYLSLKLKLNALKMNLNEETEIIRVIDWRKA